METGQAPAPKGSDLPPPPEAGEGGGGKPADDAYRVDLEIYNGPLDLLLYLIRRSEIDIYDIPIARITEQYLSYIDAIRLLDPAVGGDFLVMAATLMEIKSRMLLPTPPPEEDGEPEDPRSELVRQLLEYKRYKDAAAWLAAQADERAERFGRPTPAGLIRDAPQEQDLKEVELWDLVEAFGRLMRETLAGVPDTIVDEDVPIQVISEEILDRLQREVEVPFSRLFEGQPTRRHIVAVFLALLELVRLRRVAALQEEPFGEIILRLRGPEVVGSAEE